MNAAARRRYLRELVQTKEIVSQADLVQELAEAGYVVTQATVSRDLSAIGAARQREDGGVRYRLAEALPQPSERVTSARLAEFAESMVASGNMVVIKTRPGAAHILAGTLDEAGLDGVIGTVAGDDTVLVITPDGKAEGVRDALERKGSG